MHTLDDGDDDDDDEQNTRARGAHGNETIHTGESDTRTLTSGPEQSRSLPDKTGKLVLTRRAAAYLRTQTHIRI